MRSLLGILCLIAIPIGQLSAADADRAKSILKRTGIQSGVCAVLGHEGTLALELAKQSKLLVHVRDPRADAVQSVLKQSTDAKLGIRRLTAGEGSLEKLPYSTNSIDLVISTQPIKKLSEPEILRVLRPQGIALIGNGDKLKQLTKPALAGADDWSHWEKSPDNNPVSSDKVIKAPYLTQFLAGPFYIGMPSITVAAGGRTFLAIGHIAHHKREWNMLNKIIARNGYNGKIIWTRDLPEGYLVHRSAFIATDETLYMIGGNLCVKLDAKTGKVQGTIRIPKLTGEWKWMAMKDDVLYVLAGKPDPKVETTKGDRAFGGWSWADLSKGYYDKNGVYNRSGIPWGYGHDLAAYDMKNKKVLWTHREEELIDSRSLAMINDKMFLMTPGSHLRALSTKNGKELWTSTDSKILSLIREPGKGLRSTPGFKTMCFTVATPKALIIQGQTKMNVVAVSAETGKFLWSKKKFTNNPNAIYVDGKVIVGVGKGGVHVALDPVSGKELENFGFYKRACTRLTASLDSFFCRGEGMMRYDRQSNKVMIDGAARPACNDGAMPANGLLYLGPWQCDCNLSLIGNLAKCSAEDFRFDIVATNKDRLRTIHTLGDTPLLDVDENDWPTYRANNARSSGTSAKVKLPFSFRWAHIPKVNQVPTQAVSASGLIFIAGDNGKVQALREKDGSLDWEYATGGPIKYPPTIFNGRVYFGNGEGYVYCLEATSGRLLWRFLAAPVERHMMVYDHLTSTWPVNSGVLVKDNIAYFAAGIIDSDGTYVYAIDAITGKIKWQNHSSGHLNEILRKGVSVQGNLTIQGNRLLMAGGNQVSPAAYDLKTGKCFAKPFAQGQPKANGGKFVGVLQEKYPIAGGRILYSSPKNVATKGSFAAWNGEQSYTLNYGGIPPAWHKDTFALVNFRFSKVTCFEASKVAERIQKGYSRDRRGGRFNMNLTKALEDDKAIQWQDDLGESRTFEAVSLVVCPNAVVGVVSTQQRIRSQPSWFLIAWNPKNGNVIARQPLQAEPLPGGLIVTKDGHTIVSTLDGRVLCYGQGQSRIGTDRLRD